MSLVLTVDADSVTFNISAVGPQGPPGPSGSIADVVNLSASTSLTASQTGTYFTNAGATGMIVCSLPVAPSPFAPLTFGFIDVSGDGVEILAPAGVTIQNGSDVSSSGGNFTSTSAGNLLSILCISATLWIVTSITGIWDVT